MRHLHLEPVCGVSGDMLLSLMVDLGFDPKILSEVLTDLLKEKIEIEFEDIKNNFICGKRLKEKKIYGKDFIKKKSDLEQVLKKLKLKDEIKSELKIIFEKLFEEEEKIHREKNVFLHEIGKVDTILDILGFLLGKDFLNISSFSVGPVPLGNGFVKTSHGVISVPAPLVVNLMKGFIVIPQKGEGEVLTPTGALILNHFFKSVKESPPISFEKTGAGFGQRKTKEYPNLLKGYLGDLMTEDEKIIEIKFNLDDFTGQMAGNLMEKLFKNGAKDVLFYPVTMKKSRPGIVVEVLCYENEFERTKEIIFKESTTLGIRYKKMDRVVLDKEISKVKTPFGFLSLKLGKWKGRVVQASFEYEELKKVSEEKNIPLKEILFELNPILLKYIERDN